MDVDPYFHEQRIFNLQTETQEKNTEQFLPLKIIYDGSDAIAGVLWCILTNIYIIKSSERRV